MIQSTIGIIGGTGRMGQWFQRFFEASGHEVLISGRKTELTTDQLLSRSDVVVLSLPLRAALAKAREVAPRLGKKQLLMDLCSLKEEIMTAMMQDSTCEVLGVHPMFGPLAKSIKGQNMILCHGRGDQWPARMEELFREEGASVSHLPPATHDRNMTLVQGITHIMTIGTARMLQRLDITPEEALSFATPIFRVKLDLIGRLFTYDFNIIQALYGESHHFEEVFALFRECLDESGEKMQSDGETAVAYMEEIRVFVKDFCDQAVEESDRFLDALYTDGE